MSFLLEHREIISLVLGIIGVGLGLAAVLTPRKPPVIHGEWNTFTAADIATMLRREGLL